jgi:predicted lipase
MNLFFQVLIIFFSFGKVYSYDWSAGNASIWLCAAAYCETNTYQTRTFKGYSTGFVVTNVIDDKGEDVQGFVGYLPSQSSIYVTFRGSTSISDWANNLDLILTSYPKCDDCKVHKGFYVAQQSVISYVLHSVEALRQKFPSYTVVVTGHSLGAAMATLTTIDLIDAGISPIRMFHFGSPRVGNTNFANFASAKIDDRNRNTHHRDMVPHIPMHER